MKFITALLSGLTLLLVPVSHAEVTPGDAPPYRAFLRVDPSRALTLRSGEHGKAELDRNIYFRSYHMPGLFDLERDMELKEIGALPGRGTGPTYAKGGKHSYDAGEHGDSEKMSEDLKERVREDNQRYVKIYRAAAERFPGLDHALACNKNSYPQSMVIEDDKGHAYALQEEYYEPFSRLIAQFYDTLKVNDCSVPLWMSSQNEPHWTWGGEAFARYTRTLAETMAERHPGIKVCGPCPAWPYPGADWKRWNNFEKPFVDLAGDLVGAYDFHFYSKGYWAYEGGSLGSTAASRKQDHPSLYESQKKGNNYVWDLGRLEAYLDLLAAYHIARWNAQGPKALIVSEFGRQGIHPQLGPWENEFKQWLYMTTVTRLWMTFMDRPEVELTVPFILGEPGMTYGAQRGQAIYTRTNLPEDPTPVVTRFRDFYLFFRDFQGRRVLSDFEDTDYATQHYLRRQCLLDGDTLYILLHNGRSYPENPVSVDLRPALKGLSIRSAGIKRLRWEGPIPEDHTTSRPLGKLRIDLEYQPFEQQGSVILDGEETCLLRFELSGKPAAPAMLEQNRHYATETLRPLKQGEALAFAINLPASGRPAQAQLALGLAADGGFGSNPVLTANGQSVSGVDLAFSRGISEFHGISYVNLPAGLLQAGENRFTLRFDDKISESAYLVSAALLSSEEVSQSER